MSLRRRLLAWLLVLPVPLFVAAGPAEPQQPEGEKLLEESCTLCHGLDRAKDKPRTRAEWEAVIKRMLQLGAQIPRKQRDAIVAYLAATRGPAAVATAAATGAKAYVVNEESQDVWVLDVATRTVQSKVKVGKLPHGLTVSPDGKTLYVTNMGSNDVTVITAATGTSTTMGGTGVNPHEAAVSRDGRLLYVSNPSSNSVTVHDLGTHAPVATIPVGRFPHGLAVSPDGTRLYVANMESSDISVVDTTTNQTVGTLKTAAGPHRLALSQDGKTLYVVNFDANLFSVLALPDGREKTTAVARAPYDVLLNPDGTLWVSSADAVQVIDVQALTVTASVPVPSGAHGLALSPDRKELWVASYDANVISVVDIAQRKVLATIPAGNRPHLIAIVP